MIADAMNMMNVHELQYSLRLNKFQPHMQLTVFASHLFSHFWRQHYNKDLFVD